MKKLLGYIRVSTIKQISGHSLEFQKEAIEKYCQIYNYDLVHIYKDEGVSSYKERPKREAMLNRLYNGKDIDGVIVNDLTRFGRSTDDLLFQIKRIGDADKIFISVKDNIDISTKTGKLMLTLLSAIADYERETITERMQAGKEWAKTHGTRSGKAFGRPKLDIDFDKVRELRKAGLSWTKTAKYLGVSVPALIDRSRKEGIN